MQTPSVPKKLTNLTLDQELLSEARSFGVNLSQAAEAWQGENADALDASNRWVEENGLPLAKYRPF